jgi:hypothetical protein
MRPGPLPLAIAALLLGACGGERIALPAAGGAIGEVLVVMGSGHWEGEPGAAARSILEQPLPGLPQREPRYTVAQVPPEGFGSLLAVHHSVLFAHIGADTNAVIMTRDRHARGQMYIQISAKDGATWTDLMKTHGEDVHQLFDAHQRGMIMQRLEKERNTVVRDALRAAHRITLDLPKDYRVMKQVPGFSWLQRDRMIMRGGLEHNVIEGVFVHTHPYISDSTFTTAFLMDQRDSVTKAYVEGPNAGSYMVVQRRFEEMDLTPTSSAIELNGAFAMRLNGLFGMHGALMGGPFVSLTTVDEKRQRVVTVEGFAYAPQFPKREYIRELEAILHTLRFDPTP